VASLRNVDWGRIQTNFLVLFPSGVLESAPKFHVLLTRTPSVESSAAFQRKVVTEYPNVSVIELGLVLDVVDKLLDKVGFVIRFMALFCMVTGWFVLISSVLISKYQRMRESVLLRTMGASRRQIFAITALEYSFLGSLAALAGILLSLGAGWALSRYVFEVRFHPQWSYILLVLIGVSAVTLLIGLANSRYIVDKAPLEILRDE
jgi:putative ABC transport system permease protein